MTILFDCTDMCNELYKTHADFPSFSPVLSCEVLFSSRKTLAVQIEKDARITVRAPFHTGRTTIEAFLSSHRQWIFTHYIKQLLRLTAPAAPGNSSKAFYTGDILRFYDKQFTLQIHLIPPYNRACIYAKEECLVIDTPDTSPELLHDCIAGWYKRNGKSVFIRRADYWAALMHVSYQNITLKEQKTRWGSCSSLGNLNFNWRLLLMEPRLLDYVVVHELAHLREMNHSAAFWRIVGAYIPDYKKCRKALKSESTT